MLVEVSDVVELEAVSTDSVLGAVQLLVCHVSCLLSQL
jgi:hypothetical protein